MATVMGFDYGTKHIGIAIGETLTQTSSPLTTTHPVKQKPDWDTIGQLIEEWQPNILVVGLPLNMDDSEMAITPRARRFSNQLQGRFKIDVDLIDEKLSTREAQNRLQTTKIGASGKIDAMSAKIILETWLYEQG